MMAALVTVVLIGGGFALLYTLATGRNPVRALAEAIGAVLAYAFFGRIPGGRK